MAPSAFYGDQKYDESHVRRTEPSTGEADGFAVSDAQVRVPSCVAEGGSTAEVAVTMDYARTGPGDAEDLGAGMRVTDGDGQTYEPRDVHADPGNPAQDGRPATPAALSLTFELPIDVPGPVLLHLGGPADDVLSLDPEPAAVPTGGSADASARP